MVELEDYRDVAPQGTVDLLLRLAERVRGCRTVHVSAARFGGGVVGILQQLVQMMNDLGVETAWEVIGGDAEFFATGRAIQAGLLGAERLIPEELRQRYLEMNRLTAQKLRLEGDVVIVHDPQPVSLVEHRRGNAKWIWRCHTDLSAPHRNTWKFVRQFVARYDGVAFSLPSFAPRLSLPQYIIFPSIDPLSDRNRELSKREVRSILESLGVALDKAILLQVGPFDHYRDPLGTIGAYRLVKHHHDVRLVLAGGGVGEGLESAELLQQAREAASHDPDIIVLDLPPEANLPINALQRAATVVVQKSVRDGVALTVAEAMWKGKPLVGGATGGIPIQIIHDVTGFTVHSVAGAAYAIRQLLNNPELCARMGATGREHVRRNFLLTRHLSDYLALLVYLAEKPS